MPKEPVHFWRNRILKWKRKRNKNFWLSKLFSRLLSNFEKPEGPTRLAGLFKIKIMFSGKLWLRRVQIIQRKNWTGLSERWEGHGIPACKLLITFGVSTHYHFTTCVDQHPHWSLLGRTPQHWACTRILFNIFSFLNQFEQFLCHWTLDTPTKGLPTFFKP
jgi:hypothetical protein